MKPSPTLDTSDPPTRLVKRFLYAVATVAVVWLVFSVVPQVAG